MSDPVAAALVSRETGAGIVDMESAAIAKLCLLKAHNANGGPLECFAFRAVSDRADRDASRSFESLVDAQGRLFSRFLGEFFSVLA